MVVESVRFSTRSLRNILRGEDICSILAAAIQGAQAGQALRRHVSRDAERLIIDHTQLELDDFERIFLLGAGKASLPMAAAMVEMLEDRLEAGWVITKEGYFDRTKYVLIPKLTVIEAGHPIPDERNILASEQLLSMAGNFRSGDLVIFLLSGGGSSLLVSPAGGITLEDMRRLTTLLLHCGASISEMNTIRKHVDKFKGGGLARMLAPARVVTLILSDVLGDQIDMIASGPTAADPTTYQQAYEILEKYRISEQVPRAVRSHLSEGIAGVIPETLKAGDPILNKVTNWIVGNNLDAITGAEQAARAFGFNTRVISTNVQGEASVVGADLAAEAIAMLCGTNAISRPACLLAGGETTVTIRGDGMGGRNQELALGAVKGLSGADQIVLVTLATDGGDGPTDGAGAVVTGETYGQGMALGLDPLDYLDRNDSYHYFERLGDLIRTGPTLTNVNDLVMIFGL